jgi:hypothetical protein
MIFNKILATNPSQISMSTSFSNDRNPSMRSQYVIWALIFWHFMGFANSITLFPFFGANRQSSDTWILLGIDGDRRVWFANDSVLNHTPCWSWRICPTSISRKWSPGIRITLASADLSRSGIPHDFNVPLRGGKRSSPDLESLGPGYLRKGRLPSTSKHFFVSSDVN